MIKSVKTSLRSLVSVNTVARVIADVKASRITQNSGAETQILETGKIIYFPPSELKQKCPTRIGFISFTFYLHSLPAFIFYLG